MMDETMDEYTIAYIGNRNAASGKAEAVMVKVDADGETRTLEGQRIDSAVPVFGTQEAALAWAKATWHCNA